MLAIIHRRGGLRIKLKAASYKEVVNKRALESYLSRSKIRQKSHTAFSESYQRCHEIHG